MSTRQLQRFRSNIGDSDHDFTLRLASAQNQAARLRDQPVTVVNLNVYPLVIPDPMWSALVVPARDLKSQRYSALVITRIEYQHRTGLDKSEGTVPTFWPIQLAEEFVNAQKRNNAGGVFVVRGNLIENPELERLPEFLQAYAEADRYMIEYCTRLKHAADIEWNSVGHSNAKNIQESHRMAARVLIFRRMLAADTVPGSKC